jgi:type III pantothenate kinase
MADYFINIGNTHTQICNSELTNVETYKTASVSDYICKHFKPSDTLYCASVVSTVTSALKKLPIPTHFLTWKDLDINFDKVEPTTLGADRLANISGVSDLRGNRVVIDCGTCVTAEFLTEDNTFIGGFIMPGRTLGRKALTAYTSQLPEVPLIDHYSLFGQNTETAIQTGVDTLSGLAVEKYCAELMKIYDDLKVIFTGGDATFFTKFISCEMTIDPLLTLKGLRAAFSKKA